MKRAIAYIFAAAMTAVLLAGCIVDTGQGGHVDGKTITFTLPDYFRSGETYAGAEAGENDIAEMDIYMFDTHEGTLERVFRSREVNIDNPQSGNPTVTIEITERTGAKTFFFVANGGGKTSQLSAARYNVTTIDEFERLMSDVQAGIPAAPLLMSARMDVGDVENPLPSEMRVKLTRRVVRFDVYNDAAATNFTIKNIFINGFCAQGHVFGTAASDPSPQVPVNGSATIPFDVRQGANAGLTPSVFYAYPSIIDGGRAEIALEGELQGVTRVYTIDPDIGFSVQANKRYTIIASAMDVNEVGFNLSTEEWGDGQTIILDPTPDSMEVSPFVKVMGNGKVIDGTVYCTFGATGPGKLKFTTQTYRAQGTRVIVDYTVGGAAGLTVTVNDPEPVLTYGAYYEQTYEVDVDYGDANEYVEVTLTVINQYDPLDIIPMRVTSAPFYPGTGHKPVKVGGVWWAPFNIGARNVGGASTTAMDDAGLVFQWGRSNYGWTLTESLATLQGPLSYSTAMNAANREKFIKGRTIPSRVQDWLTPSDATLWNTPEKQNLCPPEWRLPTKAELQKLADRAGQGKVTVMPTSFAVQGDTPGEVLYIHRSHYRNFIAGTAYDTPLYWSSDPSPGDPERAYAMELKVVSGNPVMNVIDYPRANAFTIRCVAIE